MLGVPNVKVALVVYGMTLMRSRRWNRGRRPGGRVSLRGGGNCSARLALSDFLRPWNLGEERRLFASNQKTFLCDTFRPIASLHLSLLLCHPLLFIFLEEWEMIKRIEREIMDGFCLRVRAYDDIFCLKYIWSYTYPLDFIFIYLPHLWPTQTAETSLTSSQS